MLQTLSLRTWNCGFIQHCYGYVVERRFLNLSAVKIRRLFPVVSEFRTRQFAVLAHVGTFVTLKEI